MFLVSVSGATSRAGKTALAESVLRARPAGASVAVKFTTTEDVFERCPRGTRCVVCDIQTPFRIVDDETVLAEDGTDTRRLRDAGARQVVWAIARASQVDAAWAAVRERIEGRAVVVMEGSTIVDTARPDALVFVVHPQLSPARWKPTSAGLIPRADLVVVNRSAGEVLEPSPAVLETLRSQSPRALRVADVTAPFATWAGGLAEAIARA
jgi:hypothetical protein